MTTNDWSVPETDVYDRIRTALDEATEAVLATVVAVEGSAYRRPGAKMLLNPDGGGTGSITAGCLEDEVRELADDVLAAGRPRVETWDLTGDDDVWGLGVGCNGVITVLLEPLTESYRPAVDAGLSGRPVGIATVVRTDAGVDAAVGDRTHYDPEAGFGTDGLPESVLGEVEPAAERLVAEGAAETVTAETSVGSADVFLEGVRPPPELVVFGSGHDVTPVVELAKLVDFRVTVASFRGGKADERRFPRADDVVSTSPSDVDSLLEWDEDTYAVVMSHNFVDDRLVLEQLLDTVVPYVGLMGPRKRFKEMHEDLEAEGRTLTERDRERIHTPVGLSLGGDTPYQIAYSIVAELLAVAHDRTPQHLTRREGPIHDRVDVPTE